MAWTALPASGNTSAETELYSKRSKIGSVNPRFGLGRKNLVVIRLMDGDSAALPVGGGLDAFFVEPALLDKMPA